MNIELGKHVLISKSYEYKISGGLCKERGHHINFYTGQKVDFNTLNTCITCDYSLYELIRYKVGKIVKVKLDEKSVHVQWYPYGKVVILNLNDIKITNLAAFE